MGERAATETAAGATKAAKNFSPIRREDWATRQIPTVAVAAGRSNETKAVEETGGRQLGMPQEPG